MHKGLVSGISYESRTNKLNISPCVCFLSAASPAGAVCQGSRRYGITSCQTSGCRDEQCLQACLWDLCGIGTRLLLVTGVSVCDESLKSSRKKAAGRLWDCEDVSHHIQYASSVLKATGGDSQETNPSGGCPVWSKSWRLLTQYWSYESPHEPRWEKRLLFQLPIIQKAGII